MPLPVNQHDNTRKSAKALVYDSLRNWIIDGTLEPGEKLVDSNIAAYFSVSRTPVREAILALANQKLVDIIPGKFTIVSYFDINNIKNLYTAVACLHADALSLSYPHITPEVLKTLSDINQKFLLVKPTDDFNIVCDIDMEFHQVFFDLIDNSYMNTFKEELDIHSLRAEHQFFKSDINQLRSYQGHQKIIDCLTAGDLPGAVEAMKNNFMFTVEGISKNHELMSGLSDEEHG